MTARSREQNPQEESVGEDGEGYQGTKPTGITGVGRISVQTSLSLRALQSPARGSWVLGLGTTRGMKPTGAQSMVEKGIEWIQEHKGGNQELAWRSVSNDSLTLTGTVSSSLPGY